jgi:hypothetical protein
MTKPGRQDAGTRTFAALVPVVFLVPVARRFSAINHPGPETGTDLHVARIWVESAPEISPGERGPVRLAPLTPANWRHLAPGDVITMHEARPVSGTAKITETQHPLPTTT